MFDQTFAVLGKSGSLPSKELDTFPAPNVGLVHFESKELTSNCPVTGQPDFYDIMIEYQPYTLCLESKSLKLYLLTFHDDAKFAEALAAEIADDLFKAVKPHRLAVTLVQQVRGRLTLTVGAERSE